MVESSKPKIALIGSTGAIGREIAEILKSDERWSEVVLLCRKPLPEWEASQWKPKLSIVQMENFDSFEAVKGKLEGSDAFLCCLGSRVGTGEANFTKVDYTYPLNFRNLANELKVKHYGLLSSTGADPSGWLLYTKTKGRVERDIAAVNAGLGLTIYRPGLLLNRRNDDRFGEKIGAYVPFMPKIESRDMG